MSCCCLVVTRGRGPTTALASRAGAKTRNSATQEHATQYALRVRARAIAARHARLRAEARASTSARTVTSAALKKAARKAAFAARREAKARWQAYLDRDLEGWVESILDEAEFAEWLREYFIKRPDREAARAAERDMPDDNS